LREEYGFDGGYTIVKDAVREYRLRDQEVFVPLRHDPGEAQVDYGEAKVDYRGERISAAVFEMSLPYSGAIFTQVYPRECTESFQDGHRRAFEFFGCVPRRISYDNTKIAVKKIIGAHERELTDGFLRLKSHYLFESHFCRVRKPNEKGAVENLVGYSRRNFMVPVPKVESFSELNERLAL
jgi:transposase